MGIRDVIVPRLRRENRKKPTQAASGSVTGQPTEDGPVACPQSGAPESAVSPLGRPALLGPSEPGDDLGANYSGYGGAAHRREGEKGSLWNHHRCPWEAPKL